ERHHQREGDRRDHGAAHALNRAGGDQHPLRARETTHRRRGREERDSGEEEGAMSEKVTEPTPEEQAAPERDQVRVNDPGERLFREPEIGADRRERDADNGHVEDDHEVPETEHGSASQRRSVIYGTPTYRMRDP